MDIQRFYRDHGINFVTEGHKHCQEGWVNIECPFCSGNPGYHLGYNTYDNYFHCWRCGGKFPDKTISVLLNITNLKALELIREYGGMKKRKSQVKEPKVRIRRKAFKFPGTIPFTDRHKKYLTDRGFDADKIIEKWDLRATGPVALLDKAEYKHRIIAPIYWDGEIVSFQGRDITNRHKLKYKACPKERELIEHQTILYGKQSMWGETGICVEGITDVWRMGVNSFATFGIDYTPFQLRWMVKSFKRIAVIFDDDPQAVLKAKELVKRLDQFRVDAFWVDIKGDPAGLGQKEADYLIREIIGTQCVKK